MGNSWITVHVYLFNKQGWGIVYARKVRIKNHSKKTCFDFDF